MLNISFALSLNSIGCLTFSVHTYILTLPMLYPTIGIHPAAMPTTTNITIWKNFITIPTTILYKAPTRSEIIQGTAYFPISRETGFSIRNKLLLFPCLVSFHTKTARNLGCWIYAEDYTLNTHSSIFIYK